jgi:class 3 adenylate cyclase
MVFVMVHGGQSASLRCEGLARLIKDRIKHETVFSGISKSFCVGLVDVVNSTVNTARISNSKMGEYYGTFLKAMSTIVQEFGAKVVKNIGDSLLYYFPSTDYDKDSFLDVLECSLSIVDSHDIINEIMSERSLPQTDFRVSADYGTIAKSLAPAEDIFGPTVNLCSKINGIAYPNGVVIGGDLYDIVKSLKSYDFGLLGSYSVGLKFSYPVYTVTRHPSKLSLKCKCLA